MQADVSQIGFITVPPIEPVVAVGKDVDDDGDDGDDDKDDDGEAMETLLDMEEEMARKESSMVSRLFGV